MPPATFQNFMRTSDPALWTAEELASCTAKQLRTLAELLAIPRTGNKAFLAARLLNVGRVRGLLCNYDNDPQPLADAYKVKELRELCRIAGTYRWLNKRGMAAGLLSWRNECRVKGWDNFKRMQTDLPDGFKVATVQAVKRVPLSPNKSNWERGDRVLFCSEWRDFDIDRDSDIGTVEAVGIFGVHVRFDSDLDRTYLLGAEEIKRPSLGQRPPADPRAARPKSRNRIYE